MCIINLSKPICLAVLTMCPHLTSSNLFVSAYFFCDAFPSSAFASCSLQWACWMSSVKPYDSWYPIRQQGGSESPRLFMLSEVINVSLVFSCDNNIYHRGALHQNCSSAEVNFSYNPYLRHLSHLLMVFKQIAPGMIPSPKKVLTSPTNVPSTSITNLPMKMDAGSTSAGTGNAGELHAVTVTIAQCVYEWQGTS